MNPSIGDYVIIISEERKDFGKRGKIIKIIKPRNSTFFEIVLMNDTHPLIVSPDEIKIDRLANLLERMYQK